MSLTRGSEQIPACSAPNEAPATPAEVLEYPYLRDWRARYDYVLVVGPRPPATPTPAALTLIRAGDESSLYRIDR